MRQPATSAEPGSGRRAGGRGEGVPHPQGRRAPEKPASHYTNDFWIPSFLIRLLFNDLS